MNIEMNECGVFFILSNEKCQHLKKLHNSLNQHISNDQSLHDVKNHLFKVQGEPVDFNVTEDKVH